MVDPIMDFLQINKIYYTYIEISMRIEEKKCMHLVIHSRNSMASYFVEFTITQQVGCFYSYIVGAKLEPKRSEGMLS